MDDDLYALVAGVEILEQIELQEVAPRHVVGEAVDPFTGKFRC